MEVYQCTDNTAGFAREEASYLATTKKIGKFEQKMEVMRKACAANKGKKRRSLN